MIVQHEVRPVAAKRAARVERVSVPQVAARVEALPELLHAGAARLLQALPLVGVALACGTGTFLADGAVELGHVEDVVYVAQGKGVEEVVDALGVFHEEGGEVVC